MKTIIFLSIIAFFVCVMATLNFSKKEETSTINKEVVHHPSKPKFSTIPSNAQDEREKEVDRLLKKKNLTLDERQFIYDFLVETGKEKWRYIKGYEGFYRISSYGMIESVRYGKYMDPTLSRGTYIVGLCVNGEPKNYFVHRLVAETFIPNPTKSKTTKAIDGNYLNCDVKNLMWRTSGKAMKVAMATI